MARDLERKGGNQFIFEFVQRKVADGVAIGLQNATIHGVREAGNEINVRTRALYEAISKSLIDKHALRQVNHDLAYGAQQAIVTGWKSRLPVNAPGYRKGSNPDKDRLVGALGTALADSSMLALTTDRTISFLNTTVLNRDARHFLRVNYGAQGPNLSRGHQAQSFDVTQSGVSIATLRDPTSPRPESYIPTVYWSHGPSYFAPARGAKGVKPGKGVAGAHFTDLGYAYLQKEFGPQYSDMFERQIQTTNLRSVLRQHSIRISADPRRDRPSA